MPITALNSIFLPYLIPDPLLGFFPNKLFFVFCFLFFFFKSWYSGHLIQALITTIHLLTLMK